MRTIADVLRLGDFNTRLWLGAIAVCAGAIWAFRLSWLWLPVFAYGLLAVHEVLAFLVFHRGLFRSAERVARIYQWGAYFMPGYADADFEKIGDLSEGFFDGDRTKDLAQATSDKYDWVIEHLGLQPGHRVLDVGCGLGDFLAHLKERGIDGVGLTVSPDQRAICEGRGLEARVVDFRGDVPGDLVGRFDAVTFMGSLEHFVETYAYPKPEVGVRVYRRAFENAHACLAAESPIRKMFTSTLHATTGFEWSPRDRIYSYLMHGHYSGYYPAVGTLEEACRPHFKTVFTYDATEDYLRSSLVSKHHFGDMKIVWTPGRVLRAVGLFVVNPFAWATWLYHGLGVWMWQFDAEGRAGGKGPATALWYLYEEASPAGQAATA